ncbi:MAG: cation diffusion facilitator family transporter [Desulfofustis sp.]|nr:cation diffusion facilitator family transporter [Desulfofustis sp.]MBT8355134.1 cation diffusion facilitator family transporter [Desulfofustis sp.]NNK56165.1 cation transporter [Desulfofustis sp.]
MALNNPADKNWTLIEGWVSISANIVLFCLKLWVGLITGSVALMADAYHTLTDSLSSAIVIFSGWLSRKPADDKHPFGHGRSDLISSVFIGVLLALIGFKFLFKSVEQIRSGVGVEYGTAAIVVIVMSILVKESMAQFAFWAARKNNNPILKADGWHHRTDALSSIIVLAGILCSSFATWIDGALGIAVTLLIFYASWEILNDSVSRLIGETPDRDLMKQIDVIIDEIGLDVQPHHFHLHRYGDHIELTFHLTMDAGMTLEEAHEKAHLIEHKLRDQLGIEATIHMEPDGQR